jgi:NitT/TauT family transport system substrate-binding protein
MTMKITRRMMLHGLLGTGMVRPAFAGLEPVRYLLPAPSSLPAFIPFHVAIKRGYFSANNIDLKAQSAPGAVEVAKQVAVRNMDLGGALGETTMIVRPNGLAVRGVALLGDQPLFQLVTRKAANVKTIADLRGKKLGVIGYQDTGYYALLAVLAANGLARSDVEIESVGPAGVTQLMIAQSLDGIMAVIEWADAIEMAGVPLDYFKIDGFFPAMAQSIVASDAIIRERPAVVGGVVKAMMQALRDCISDPASCARDFVASVPQQAGKENAMERILRRYVSDVYRTENPTDLGRFDPARLKKVQSFYVTNKIIPTAVPIEDLYTNAFVG